MYTVVPALGDPRRERPPAVYGHFVNVPTHFNVQLPLSSGHLPNANADSHLLVVSTCYNGQSKQMPRFRRSSILLKYIHLSVHQMSPKPLQLQSWNSHIVHALPRQRRNSFQNQLYCPFYKFYHKKFSQSGPPFFVFDDSADSVHFRIRQSRSPIPWFG